jgi:phage shock protein PspC (stress-responsive transcriptional regulator)
VADQYAGVDHNFEEGFSPGFLYAKTELRKSLRVKVYGTISDENRAINASGLQYNAPENVYGVCAGIGNIFKVFHRFCMERKIIKHTSKSHRFAKGSLVLFLAISSYLLHYIFNAKKERMSSSGLKKSVHESSY